LAFKKCRNEGCEVLIEVRNTAEGWRPYEESGSKHNCQFSEYAKKQKATFGERLEMDKDDHGNEETFQGFPIATKSEYVDHTLARPSKVKIFHSESSDLVEIQYNEFLESKKFQWTRAQLGTKGNEFAIALYYEETKQ
jgi:hypothetical protein